MEVIRYQVVVIGAGCAGLRAALQAARSGRETRVACVSKHHAFQAGCSGPGGGAAGPLDDSEAERHAYETVVAGDFLADQEAVELLAVGARAELSRLGDWGVPWTRGPGGTVQRRRMGGTSAARAWYVRDRTPAHVHRALLHSALAEPSIDWLHEHVATRLLIEDGRCCGVAVLSLRTGQVKAVLGQSVVLATGGAIQLFAESTGGSGETGDGMALAYRAGVRLRDMELVQLHPTGCVPGGAALSDAVLGEGAVLRNGSREICIELPPSGDPGRRDQLARAMLQELLEGRGIASPHGPVLELDLRSLDIADLARRYPTLCRLADLQRSASPPRAALWVRPSAHRLLGGVLVNPEAETSIPGLLAAGDVASSGAHGANALAGNALTAALVFGARAGARAAEWAHEGSEPPIGALTDQVSAETARLERVRLRKGGEREAEIRRDLGRLMERTCGPFRDAVSLRTAVREIAALKVRHSAAALSERSTVWSGELLRLLELGCLLDVAEALAAAALERRESRGVHARTDFRERSDGVWLAHTLTHYQPSGPFVELAPAVQKRWAPGEAGP